MPDKGTKMTLLPIPTQRWLQQQSIKLSSVLSSQRDEPFSKICAEARDLNVDPQYSGPLREQLLRMGKYLLINRDDESIRTTVIGELTKPMPRKAVPVKEAPIGANSKTAPVLRVVTPSPSSAPPKPGGGPEGGPEKPSTGDEAAVAAEIKRLASLSPLEYENKRKDAVKLLGFRAQILDRLVAAERAKSGDGKQGHALDLVEPEPWDEAVNGAALLDELSATFRGHVVMPDYVADAIALWTVHTFLLDTFNISPRLAILSPEMGCGKTTLLDVIAHLVWRPLETANASAAAVFRVVEKKRPTLLMDEGDTFIPEKEELRGILNSGHRRGGSVIRTVGDDFEPRSFSTYCACAIALIGKLPATLADRSIPIELKRRRSDEPITALRLDRTKHLDDLARKSARWAAENGEKLNADPEMPDDLFNRTADNWCPLLAIADQAGGEWPEKARLAAAKLAGATGANTVGTDLLVDVKVVFDKLKVDERLSRDLVQDLTEDPESRWHEWKGPGKPLTLRQLAGLLGKFRIISEDVRPGGIHGKGYRRSRFEDAWARYLEPLPPFEACKRANIDETGTSGTFSSVQESKSARIENDYLGPFDGGLHACTDEKGGSAAEDQFGPENDPGEAAATPEPVPSDAEGGVPPNTEIEL
jgi:hypothetical protein